MGLAGGTDNHVGFLTAVSDTLQRHRSPVTLAFAQGWLRHCDPASFSCLRYLLLPEVTRLMSGPVMTLDADAQFPADFVALADALTRDFDYGFRLYAYDRDGRQIAGEPWGFGAGVSYFGETALVPVIAQELIEPDKLVYRPVRALDRLSQAYRATMERAAHQVHG